MSNPINYRLFALEAFKITLLCLLITFIFELFQVSNDTLLIVFNMAVMSSAATFSLEQKCLNHVALGCTVMIVSIILGGVLGFYYPNLATFISIIYAGLAFYLPKMKYQLNIFVTSSLMFLIFSTLPFNLIDGLWYSFDGLIVLLLFIVFHWLLNLKLIQQKAKMKEDQIKNNYICAILITISLSLAALVSYILSLYTNFSHLFWIGLTALVIIQSSQQNVIQTSVKRILINTFGAIFIVILFNYVIPSNFGINFMLLVLFLFLIFFLNFSYTGRTLFIELFVLGFIHLFGNFQNAIALDRVIMTFIGGLIVIFSTPIAYFFSRFFKQAVPLHHNK